jgi:hypothetical protein
VNQTKAATPTVFRLFVGAAALCLGAMVAVVILVAIKKEHVATADAQLSLGNSEPIPRLRALSTAASLMPRRSSRPSTVIGKPTTTEGGATARPEEPREVVRAFLARYQAEPRNEIWAREAEASYRVDLALVADSAKATITDFQCRSTTCAGRVQWKDATGAAGSWSKFIHYPYRRDDCSRGILLDDPVDAQGGRGGTLFFDCAGGGQGR